MFLFIIFFPNILIIKSAIGIAPRKNNATYLFLELVIEKVTVMLIIIGSTVIPSCLDKLVIASTSLNIFDCSFPADAYDKE